MKVKICELKWEEVKAAAEKKLAETQNPKIRETLRQVLAVYEPVWEKAHLYTYYADDN